MGIFLGVVVGLWPCAEFSGNNMCVALMPPWRTCVALVWPVRAVKSSCVYG